MELPKLSDRVFHTGAHLLSDENMSNEGVVRCITLMIQNTEIQDHGMFSQVVKYFYFLICLLLQGVYDMVISTANIVGVPILDHPKNKTF